MSEATSPATLPAGCSVRRFRPTDAEGVTQLVKGVYGDSYYPPALYDPQKIVHLNETEKLISVLAVDEQSDVIGHYGLERPDGAAVAEASDAIVAVPFRHH